MPEGPGVAELLDRLAVHELTATYNRCFDEADADGWAATFVEDGVLEVVDQGVAYRGRDEIRAFCEARGWGYLHLTTDAVVTVNGDRAVQRCNLLMLRRWEDKRPPALLSTGRYVDDVVRTADGWRFRHRQVTLDADLTAARHEVGA